MDLDSKLQLATIGGGCFWCTEAFFVRLKGVSKVVSGYTGGKYKNPTYKEICYGRTGHAEVIQVTFDPEIISYEQLLHVFFDTHDPTTLNRQGNDTGTQYRSAIFYHSDEQRKVAEKVKAEVDQSAVWDNPVVTEITALDVFYEAEEYHQNYFELNPQQPYCAFLINPKIQKFEVKYSKLLK